MLAEGGKDIRHSGTLRLHRLFRTAKKVLLKNGTLHLVSANSPDYRGEGEVVELTRDCVVETSPRRRTKFTLVSRVAKLTFEAANEAECANWVDALRTVIAEHPSGKRDTKTTMTSAATTDMYSSSMGDQSQISLDASVFPTRYMQSVELLGDIFLVEACWTGLKPIAVGATGRVAMATHRGTGTRVAIKKVGNAFNDVVDMKRLWRELRYLSSLSHPNIVQKLDATVGHVDGEVRDLYILTEWMHTDLHQLIHGQHKMTFSPEQVLLVTYQLFCGLNYLHSANVIHRDIKPANILVNSDFRIKLCDFGLSTATFCPGREVKTEYVVTRWYRAPEIILAAGSYDERVDVWSAGCVVAEMLLMNVLFLSDNYLHQLDLIISTLGTPSDDELQFVRKPRALTYIRRLPPAVRQPFNLLFPDVHPDLRTALEGCLQFSPNRRLRACDVLALHLFDPVRSLECQQEASHPVEVEDIENAPLVRSHLVDMIMREGEAYACYRPARREDL